MLPYSIRCHACGHYRVTESMIFYNTTDERTHIIRPYCKQDCPSDEHPSRVPSQLTNGWYRLMMRYEDMTPEYEPYLQGDPTHLPVMNSPLVPPRKSNPRPHTSGWKPHNHTPESLSTKGIHITFPADQSLSSFIVGIQQMYGFESVSQAIFHCIRIMHNNARLPVPFPWAPEKRPTLPEMSEEDISLHHIKEVLTSANNRNKAR